MKKLLLSVFLAVPTMVLAQQTIVFDQAFDKNVSSNPYDYKLSTAGGAVIADSKTVRFDSFGATTPPANTTYGIDVLGLKISKASNSTAQAVAQISDLSPVNGADADVAFVQFDFSVSTNTAFAPASSSPVLFFVGQGFPSNSNADDQNTKAYTNLGVYYPEANSNKFGLKVGTTAVGTTYDGTQKITWVINRKASSVTYTGPGGISSTVDAGSYDVWVGTDKLDISAATVPITVAGNELKDFRFRTAATWIGYAAMKNVVMGYLQSDGSGVINSANTVFEQAFDENISNTLLDYKVTKNAGNVAQGTVGGPIADNKTVRLSSMPNHTAQNAGFYYSVGDNGFTMHRTNSDVKQTAHVGNLDIPDNSVVFAQFDMTVNANTNNGTYTPVFLYLGEGYTNSASDQGTKHFQAIGFKFPSANSFYVNSNDANYTFTGTQHITWVVNRTAAPVNYKGLDGSTYTLTADGGYNVWVGNTRLVSTGSVVLGEGATKSNDVQIKDFRIRLTTSWSANSSISFKNLAIGYIPSDGTGEVLPVKLSQFQAKANHSNIQLNWQTESENNAAYFNVTRSTNGIDFSKIGQVAAANKASSYRYTDFSPAKGLNYYQLEQVDRDGKSEKSAIVSAYAALRSSDFSITNSSTNEIGLSIFTEKAETAQITLSNISGQLLANSKVQLSKGQNSVSIPCSYKGLVLVSVSTNEGSSTKKTIK